MSDAIRHHAPADPGLPGLAIDDRVATITLRRAEVANRLNPEDLAEIRRHIDAVNDRPVLVLRLRGEGRYFCSGFDIGRMAPGGTRAQGEGGRGSGFEDVVNALEDCRPVTIAALHGGVFGGGTDLALACDFRIGTPRTEMFMPAARLGLHFYRRGMERYVSRLGLDAAKRLFLTAEKIDAQEMARIGFLTELVHPDALDARVDALTDVVSGLAPLAVFGMKKHLNRIGRGALDADELQADVRRAAASQDIREGALAWKEKRKPRFEGR